MQYNFIEIVYYKNRDIAHQITTKVRKKLHELISLRKLFKKPDNIDILLFQNCKINNIHVFVRLTISIL